MIKGTTPTHIYTLPIDTVNIKTIAITYAQNGTVKLTKCTEDCTFDGNNVSCRLTQEDTLKFDGDACVEIQVRVLTVGEDALASHIMRTRCCDCLSDEVIA